MVGIANNRVNSYRSVGQGVSTQVGADGTVRSIPVGEHVYNQAATISHRTLTGTYSDFMLGRLDELGPQSGLATGTEVGQPSLSLDVLARITPEGVILRRGEGVNVNGKPHFEDEDKKPTSPAEVVAA